MYTQKPKRRIPIHKQFVNIFFSEIFFVLSFIFLEIVFHISVFRDLPSAYPILFAIPAGFLCGAICDFFGEKTARVLRFLLYGIFFVLAGVQKVYHYTFFSFMSVSQLGMADDIATNFLSETLYSIYKCLPTIFACAIPLVALALIHRFIKPQRYPNPVGSILTLCCCLALQLGAVYGALPLGGTQSHTAYDNYHTNWVPELSMEKLGLITTTRIDFQKFFFPSAQGDGGEDLPSASPNRVGSRRNYARS